MNFLRQRTPSKVIIYTSIVLLLMGVVVVILFNTKSTRDIDKTPSVLLSTTPTPYPLPTQSYDIPSNLRITTGQLLGEQKQWIDPSQITSEGKPLSEDRYFNLYSTDDFLPVDIRWWQQQSKQVYDYGSKRLDISLSEKVIITFRPPNEGNCPARGATFHEQPPVILIFADQGTSQEQILGVLAHELGHVLVRQKYVNLSDVALNEGMATWAAGDYWKEWKGMDFNSAVTQFIKNNTYLPLFQNYDMQKAYDENSVDCISYRDTLYTEWASFLDFLIKNYGLERLSSLFDVQPSEVVYNKRTVYPPNFKDVYGLELNQLEYEWLNSILQYRK